MIALAQHGIHLPFLESPDGSIGHFGSPLHNAVRMASSAAGSGDTGAITVFVTVPSEKVGEEIAGLLVNPEARLAACVNIIPGTRSPAACMWCPHVLHSRVHKGCSVVLGSSLAHSHKTTTAQLCLSDLPCCCATPTGFKLLNLLPPILHLAVIGDDAGLKSIYWWDGKVQKDEELLLVMKTQTALLQQLVEAVKKHHPYDEPEVISLPITGGSSSYIKWIHDSTGGS